MAQVAFTEHDTAGSATDTDVYVFTVTALDANTEYLVAIYAATATVTVSSLVGLGPTWAFIGRAGTSKVAELWRGRTGGSPSGTTLTVTWSSTGLERCAIGIYKAANAKDETPTNTDTQDGIVTSLTFGLAALGANSGTFLALGKENTEAVTLAGFTAHTAVNPESTSQLQVFTLDGQDADFTASWTTSAGARGVAVEVKAADAAQGGAQLPVESYDSLAFEGLY